jgi:hypothetical protein
VSLYKAPPPATHVLCVDEMGPVSAKTYPAPRWSPDGFRPRIEADYGRRGKLWTFGAFEPHTGLALTHCALRRDSHHFTEFLDLVTGYWPDGDLILILDNLSIHRSIDVLLWAVAHPRVRFLFQPTYSPWLNLIEPWWKTLRSLALKGRTFDTEMQIQSAILGATGYWNERKRPYYWRKAA